MKTSLKSPKITAGERTALKTHLERLTAAINAAEAECKSVIDLRKKERKFQREADELKHHAAMFDRDSEIKLSATLKQLERISVAISEAESRAFEKKTPLFRALDDAQEQVGKICQASLAELVDLQAAALAPFWASIEEAKQIAKGSSAVRHLVRTLLTHNAAEFDSIERLDEAARDILRKVEALLNGSEIWQFQGAPISESAAAAA